MTPTVKRPKLRFVKRPSIVYMQMADREVTIRSRVRDIGGHIAITARSTAWLKQPDESFSIVVDVPGSPSDIPRISRQLRRACRDGLAEFVDGFIYEDEGRLRGRITFKVKKR